MLLLGKKQKQGDEECSPKQNSRQEWEGFGEKEKKNSGEDRNSGELLILLQAPGTGRSVLGLSVEV